MVILSKIPGLESIARLTEASEVYYSFSLSETETGFSLFLESEVGPSACYCGFGLF